MNRVTHRVLSDAEAGSLKWRALSFIAGSARLAWIFLVIAAVCGGALSFRLTAPIMTMPFVPLLAAFVGAAWCGAIAWFVGELCGAWLSGEWSDNLDLLEPLAPCDIDRLQRLASAVPEVGIWLGHAAAAKCTFRWRDLLAAQAAFRRWRDELVEQQEREDAAVYGSRSVQGGEPANERQWPQEKLSRV